MGAMIVTITMVAWFGLASPQPQRAPFGCPSGEGGLVATQKGPISKFSSPAFLSSLVRSAHAAESRAYLSSSSPLQHDLAAVERELQSACACDSFRVRWDLNEELIGELNDLAAIEGVSWNRVSPETAHERVAVQVRGQRDGRARIVWVQGVPECRAEAYRSRRGLTRGMVIADQDRERATDWMPPVMARDVQELRGDPAGLYVVQPLGRDAWIGASSVRSAPAVRRGEVLQILVRSEGFEVRCSGRARRDAWIGDRITVRVDGASKDCEGAVVGDGLVEVGVPRHGSAGS